MQMLRANLVVQLPNRTDGEMSEEERVMTKIEDVPAVVGGEVYGGVYLQEEGCYVQRSTMTSFTFYNPSHHLGTYVLDEEVVADERLKMIIGAPPEYEVCPKCGLVGVSHATKSSLEGGVLKGIASKFHVWKDRPEVFVDPHCEKCGDELPALVGHFE